MTLTPVVLDDLDDELRGPLAWLCSTPRHRVVWPAGGRYVVAQVAPLVELGLAEVLATSKHGNHVQASELGRAVYATGRPSAQVLPSDWRDVSGRLP